MEQGNQRQRQQYLDDFLKRLTSGETSKFSTEELLLGKRYQQHFQESEKLKAEFARTQSAINEANQRLMSLSEAITRELGNAAGILESLAAIKLDTVEKEKP